jgi:hypothetical protein
MKRVRRPAGQPIHQPEQWMAATQDCTAVRRIYSFACASRQENRRAVQISKYSFTPGGQPYLQIGLEKTGRLRLTRLLRGYPDL